MDAKSWVLSWFAKNTDVPEQEIAKDLSANYLDKGWIDSLKFISLVSDIEDDFRIRFSNDEFHDRSFATVGGLIGVIEKKLGEKAR